MNPLDGLKDKVLSKKGGSQLTSFFQIAREFGCLSDILGRDYEVFDTKGQLLYKIRQKPLRFDQIDIISKELNNILKKESKGMGKK